MEKLIIFIKNLWTQTIAPTIESLNRKNKANTDSIVEAIENIPVDEPQDISPIVEAQKETTQAIKDIPKVDLPDIDLTPLEEKLESLRKTFESKEMSIKIGKTKVNVDTKSVVKAIERLQLTIPELKPKEQTDYTLMLDEIMTIMERPQDHTEIIKVQELLKPLSKTEDMAIICEYLQQLIDKPVPEFPELPTKDGRILVEVDRVGGGGGGGLTSIETGYLKEIAENTADIELNADTINLNTDGLETLQDPLAKYKIADKDDDAEPNYFGFTDTAGNYYILKEESNAYRYTAGNSGYATAWTNRATQTYDYLFNITL